MVKPRFGSQANPSSFSFLFDIINASSCCLLFYWLICNVHDSFSVTPFLSIKKEIRICCQRIDSSASCARCMGVLVGRKYAIRDLKSGDIRALRYLIEAREHVGSTRPF